MFSRLISDLLEGLDPQGSSADPGEATPVTPRNRVRALLLRAGRATRGLSPSLGDHPDRQEAGALAQRYLEAGWREWEAHHWGLAGLFAEPALEWAARAGEGRSHGPRGSVGRMRNGRTEPPHEEHQMRGTIKRVIYERGFGFILAEDGKEVFFHQSSLEEPIFQDLRGGEAVEFEVTQDRRGPRATHVRRVPPPEERSGGTFG